jgi:ferredoxin--NADP+ reductase
MVGEEQKLACVDGPWFDGKAVSWDYLLARENLYEEEERIALEKFLKQLERERLRARK